MLVKPHLTFNLKLKLSRMKKAHYKLIWIVAIATSIVACMIEVSTT